MRSTITLNGKNSSEIEGLLIQSLPPISKPLMRTQIEEIEGRDGDIVTQLGFSSYNKEFSIGLYGDFDINEVISYFTSQGTVIFSNEPDKYYNYEIIEQIDFDRLIRFRTATVRMHCQPFKYSATEGTEVFSPSSNLISFDDFTQTSNGVTLTASNGTITITGTPSAATEFYLPLDNVNLAEGNYTLAATTNGTNGNYCSMRMIGSRPADSDSFGGRYITFVNNGTVSLNATLDQSKSYGYLWFYMNAGTALNFSLTVMLTNTVDGKVSGEGSLITLQNTALAPFSKFDIKGNIEQDAYSGKNLIGDFVSQGTNNGLTTVVNSDGSLSVSGQAEKAYSTFTNTKAFTTPVPNGTTITFSIKSSITGRLTLAITDTGGANRQDVIIPAGSTSVTVTTNSQKVNYWVWCQSLTVGNNYNFKIEEIQLEANSAATDYEPYVGGTASPSPDYPQTVQVVTGEQTVTIDDGGLQRQDYTVNLGKNLFDKDNAVTIMGTVGSYFEIGSTNKCLYIPCEPNTTYTVQKRNDGDTNRFAVASLVEIPANGSQFINRVANNNASNITINTGAGAKYLIVQYWRIYEATLTEQQVLDSIQIEKGSTATEYAPYFEPIELCKIGDFQDKIYKSGDDWYIHKEVGKVVLGGDEANWSLMNATTGYTRANLTTLSSPQTTGFCDNFTFRTGAHGAYEYIWFRQPSTGGGCFVQVNTDRLTANTLDAFKNWLSSHNTTVYYALTTPTDTKITDAALIEQLENLIDNSHAYKGTTNLAATSENIPHIMAVETAKNNDATITNSGNTTAKPVITIYGSGTIGLYLNGYQMFTINLGDQEYITIDIANMEAYKDTPDNLQNRIVDGDYDNFALQVGENSITFSGTVTKWEISNYSRWI